MAMWVYDLGRSLTGFNPAVSREKLAIYRQQVEKLQTERDGLSTTVNASHSQRTMEEAAQNQLMKQLKVLETENLKLKEDLAFFESLLPSTTGPQGISVRRFKAELIASNQLRYRLLIMQGGKGEQDFVGNLQLVVTVMQQGKGAMMTFPDTHSSNTGQYKLEFKHYQRLEGVLTLPDGVTIKSVQARIMDKGQVRAQQSVNL